MRPDVDKSDTVIITECRADVVNMLSTATRTS